MDSFQSIIGQALTVRNGSRELRKNSAFYRAGQTLVLAQVLCKWEIKVCILLMMMKYAKGVESTFLKIVNAVIIQDISGYSRTVVNMYRIAHPFVFYTVMLATAQVLGSR